MLTILICEDPKGGGCGGAMRAMVLVTLIIMDEQHLLPTRQCIGLRFPGEKNRDNLIAVSIESGRMTQ